MNFTEEQMKKFNETKSIEEALALAKEEGVDVPEAEIRKFYFATHKSPEGELSDDELDNVAGGIYACNDGRMVTTLISYCTHWKCYNCGGVLQKPGEWSWECEKCGSSKTNCDGCVYCTYEKGMWLCNHKANRNPD